MKIRTETIRPETPKGKRTVRQNIYGNWVGYVSGRVFHPFGDDELAARCWQAGSSLDQAYIYRMPNGEAA